MADEHSAGFVVFRKQAGKRTYLLLFHIDGRWDFPKGNIERGETNKDAAVRELKEETGIKWVRQISGWDKTIKYFYRKGGQPINKEVTFFLCEAPDDKVTISDEHRGSDWFSYEEAMTKMKFENARNILESADKFLRMRS